MPSARRTSMQPWMASLMLAMASSSVLPCETHPGMAGHSAMIMPVSSRWNVTTRFTNCSLHPDRRLVYGRPELGEGSFAGGEGRGFDGVAFTAGRLFDVFFSGEFVGAEGVAFGVNDPVVG